MLATLPLCPGYVPCPTTAPAAARWPADVSCAGASRAAVARRATLLSMQEPQQKNDAWWKAGIQTAELLGTMVDEAKKATDSYINSGWQVKKRAGQVLPEIRPNAADIGERSTEQWLPSDDETPAGVGGAIAPVPSGDGALSTVTDGQLQGQFLGFLDQLAEQDAFVEGPKGEVTFASREALAGVVASFTYTKLRELSAATKALARYVDDLEAELEASDEEVVTARKAQRDAERAQKAAEKEALDLQATQQTALSELREAAASADVQLAARQQAEREAEAAAERMLEMKSQLKASAAAEKDAVKSAAKATAEAAEATARAALVQARGELVPDTAELLSKAEAQGRLQAEAESAAAMAAERVELVKLEEQLMRAEEEAAAEEARRVKLETALAQVEAQQRAAAAQKAAEEARAAELEARAAAAEEAAQRKADELEATRRDKEAEVAQLQAALEALSKVQQEQEARAPPPATAATVEAAAAAAAAAAAPKPRSKSASKAAKPNAKPNAKPKAKPKAKKGAATEGMFAELVLPDDESDDAAPPAANGAAKPEPAVAAVAPPPPPPPPPPPAVNGFEAEAAELASELSRIAGDISGGGAAAANGKVKLPALSSMKKAQLVAECEERGVESDGTVAELRAMLRVERKRDAKIAELEERGWADKQARAALAKCEWDVDLAISQLLKK